MERRRLEAAEAAPYEDHHQPPAAVAERVERVLEGVDEEALRRRAKRNGIGVLKAAERA